VELASSDRSVANSRDKVHTKVISRCFQESCNRWRTSKGRSRPAHRRPQPGSRWRQWQKAGSCHRGCWWREEPRRPEGLSYIAEARSRGPGDRGTKTGGIETREAPIHVSNVQLVNPRHQTK
jgi:hypothetical protein